MIHTPLCDILGIEHPVIQAGMGPFTSALLAATVSNAGGLGTISTFLRPVEEVRRELALLPALTDRPFAVNHVIPALDEEAFALGLAARPKLVSLALAEPGDLVKRAHDAGALVMQQVTTVAQAVQASAAGVDIIVAQGGEAGGYGGAVAGMALIPQVVDAVAPIPVVAAGGIFDGRGLAAALVLGAAGVNVGTRFLAAAEAPISDAYKELIIAAASEDAIKADVMNDIVPVGNAGYGTVLRTIRTPFIDEWQQKREEARREVDMLRQRLLEARSAPPGSALLVATAGQSAGGIKAVFPAATIVRNFVTEAEEALAHGGSYLRSPSARLPAAT